MTPGAGDGLGKRARLPGVGGRVCPRVFGELLGLLAKIIGVYTLYPTSYSLTTYSAYTSGQNTCIIATPYHGGSNPRVLEPGSTYDAATQQSTAR